MEHQDETSTNRLSVVIAKYGGLQGLQNSIANRTIDPADLAIVGQVMPVGDLRLKLQQLRTKPFTNTSLKTNTTQPGATNPESGQGKQQAPTDTKAKATANANAKPKAKATANTNAKPSKP